MKDRRILFCNAIAAWSCQQFYNGFNVPYLIYSVFPETAEQKQ